MSKFTEVEDSRDAVVAYVKRNAGVDDLVPVLKVDCEYPGGTAYCDSLRQVEDMLTIFFGDGGEWETGQFPDSKVTITVVRIPEAQRVALEPFEGF